MEICGRMNSVGKNSFDCKRKTKIFYVNFSEEKE